MESSSSSSVSSSPYPPVAHEKGFNQKCNNILIEMFVRLDGSLHSHDTHSVKCHYMRTMLILFLGHHFHLNCNYVPLWHVITSVIIWGWAWYFSLVTISILRTISTHHSSGGRWTNMWAGVPFMAEHISRQRQSMCVRLLSLAATLDPRWRFAWTFSNGCVVFSF